MKLKKLIPCSFFLFLHTIIINKLNKEIWFNIQKSVKQEMNVNYHEKYPII